MNTKQRSSVLTGHIQKLATPTPQGQALNVGDELPLDRISRNGSTQARAGLDDATVADYAQAMRDGATFPLIIVYYDGTDHWLADGFHRVEAAQQIGRSTIRAEVRQGDKRAAILYAVGANDKHGLRRTQADKRRAAATLLRDTEWGQWSDSAIAKQVNVDHKTVASVRAELVATGEIPGSDVRQSADGKARNVTGIATSNASRAKPPARDLGPGQPEPEPWPAAPEGWRWNRRGAPAHLIAPGGWRTADYNYPERALAEAQQYIVTQAPFWQSLDAHHPTAHFWTRERPDLLRSACGMTIQNRLPSGSTEGSHCSSCVQTTWKTAPAASPATPAPDLADILRRLDAHGYAKTGTRQKGMTTFYSFRDYRSTLDDGQAGELELAEGELPIWLAELDSNAAYAQAKQEKYLSEQARAARLGYDLRRDGARFMLTPTGKQVPALVGTLDSLIKTVDGYEQNAAKQVAAEPALTIEQLDDCLPKGYERRGYFWVTATPPTLGHIDGWRGDAPTIAGAISQAADREKAPAHPPASGDQASRLTAAIDLMESILGENPRGAAVVLLGALAKAMKDVQATDLEGLSQAISDLNECQEGTEAAHWLNVGYALLDREKD